MIEVEKKFTFKAEDIKRLTKDAEFIIEQVFTDIYYDTEDYSLTTKDRWLRSRDGKFQLKMPFNKERISIRSLDQYEEIESEPEIRNILNLLKQKTFSEDLKDKGYLPFATLVTTRKKYKNGEFILDFDVMDFGYNLFEIELMVNNESEIEQATNKIINFAKQYGIKNARTRGKLIEYIKRKNPKQFQILIDAGVI